MDLSEKELIEYVRTTKSMNYNNKIDILLNPNITVI